MNRAVGFPCFRNMLIVALPLFLAGAGLSLASDTRPVNVMIEPVSELVVYPKREALAVVLPRNESRLSAEVTAVVATTVAEVGQQVQAGDVLATLDETDIRLSLSQALAAQAGLRARLQLARRQLKRLRDLKSNNFVSTEAVNQRDAEVVSLRAELKGNEAQVAIIRRQLDKCSIRAPFDAIVSARNAQVGELAVPGAVMFTLVELGGEQVAANVSVTDANHLTVSAGYTLHALGRSVPLTLQRVSPLVSRQTRSREARLLFSRPEQKMPAGTEGRLRWRDSRPHLPANLLVRRNNRLGVFVVRDQKAFFVAVPGAQEGRPSPSPVALSAVVVRDGQARLQHGMAVRLGRPES